ASLGVAVFRVSDDCTVTKLLGRADTLLYQAKNQGRNRVCAEDPAPMFPADEVTQDEKAALFSSFKQEE
uniref:diguanylate cyclase domain-containing protein n=1 Tax=Halalkalibacter lacteus TaxID=3090663 RepID=UPI002FC619CF